MHAGSHGDPPQYFCFAVVSHPIHSAPHVVPWCSVVVVVRSEPPPTVGQGGRSPAGDLGLGRSSGGGLGGLWEGGHHFDPHYLAWEGGGTPLTFIIRGPGTSLRQGVGGGSRTR